MKEKNGALVCGNGFRNILIGNSAYFSSDLTSCVDKDNGVPALLSISAGFSIFVISFSKTIAAQSCCADQQRRPDEAVRSHHTKHKEGKHLCSLL